MPYNISIKFHPIPSTLNFSRFLWQRRPFWNFYASKLCVQISGKFHPISSTIANQRWISIRNIIIYFEPNFAEIGGFFIWRPFCTLVTMATAAILNLFNPPKTATYYGGYSYKVDHNMASKPWISIPNIKIYLETKFRPNLRIFVFWRPFWIQNGRHRKPMMDINYSQHHNLLGNQISPKSEDFCILDSKWPPKQTNDEYQFATS